MNRHELDELRQQIAATDEKLIELIATRMRLAQKIGDYKKKHGLPVKDYKVEKQVLDKARAKAKSLQIYGELVDDVMRSLIKYSVIHQNTQSHKPEPVTAAEAKQILIVGGAGNMGQWLAQFCDSLGHRVQLYDLVRPRQPQVAFPFADDLASVVTTADMIFLATPLSRTASALASLIPMQPKGVVVEIASLKTPVRDALYEASRAGLKVNAIHPMFGPQADVLLGKNLVICEDPNFHSSALVASLFQHTSLSLVHLPFALHDQLMSYVLGSAHLLNLVNARVLMQSGLPMADIERVAGTTFAQQLNITRAVVQENQDLYYEIQQLNDQTPALLTALRQALADYEASLQNQGSAAFRQLMTASQNYLISSTKAED